MTSMNSYRATGIILFRNLSITDIKRHASCKSYEDIPKSSGLLPATLELILAGGPGYLHEHCDKRHKKLGPIFRERLGSSELVFIADTKMIQTVIANEGPLPHHNVPEAWLRYNEVKKLDRGLFFQLGEPWQRMRRAFNKVLLTDTSTLTPFINKIIQVNTDLFDSWQDRYSDDKGLLIQDIKFELSRWSIEATGVILFGHRMACIPNKQDISEHKQAERLVEYVAEMFEATSRFQILPCSLAQRLNLYSWQEFVRASDGMMQLANAYVEQAIQRARKSDLNPSLVKNLLDLELLNDEEISRSMVDMIIAASDTTSNSLQWVLFSLAKYPHIQERIFKELEKEIRDIPQASMVTRLKSPYLNAFVKEVFRLYPTAPFLARTLNQDIILGGFQIPAKVPIVFSLYTTSRSTLYFKEPLAMKPERWLRLSDSNLNRTHAYATLPFGVGPRMCIGRRMADLEMHLLLVSLILKYQLLLDGEQDVKIKLKMILSPDRPIHLRLIPRSKQPYCDVGYASAA